MKRNVTVVLLVATVGLAFAAVGARLGVLGYFGHRQQLPALHVQDLPFRYPARLWREGVEGEVLLRVHITEAGIVDSVELERSSGSVELDEIALSGARRLAYQPAKQGDQAVAVWAVLPIRFERSTGSVAAQER